MPSWIPPEQYVRTIENATVYGSLFFTNFSGWPVLLLSVHGEAVWQFPGGDVEKGETPWEAALRECSEETGQTFAGPERLLLTHYARPQGSWPLARIGLVFDGGALADHRINDFQLNAEEHRQVRALPMYEWRKVMPAATYAHLEAVYRARKTDRGTFLFD